MTEIININATEKKEDKIINIKIPAELHRRLKIYAASTEKQVKNVTIEALEVYLNGKGV